ncbi:general secretion pathway protein GspK [Methylorubrum salsuginis]|uniref:General secretion pathway protein K n=1 Tax=Methylorubrum salsuginis TaxID=414703 RepID=A0A1I3Z7S5_9HYPH|nr:type II secretion system protein GspK [Methylorubrum salsuginis]SFK39639.1 general secretion pathway protein K [Methylorubrum salsuginis]
MRASPRRGRRDGFILVAVLGVMALLASLLGGTTVLVRAAFEGVQAKSDDLALDGLVRAGLDLAAYELYGLKLPPALIDGQEIRLDAGTVTLSVTDEAGRIDLNGAAPILLASTYQAVGGRSLRPEAFAARVVAWRDRYEPKDGPAHLGAALRPPDGNARLHRREGFRSIGELRWLPGITAAEAEALAGLVTVNNPGGKVDVTSAPLAVLLALPGMQAPLAQQILALRRRPDGPDRILPLLKAQGDVVATKGGGAHRVRLEARRGAGALRRAEAVITRAPAKLAPYFVVEWSG